MLQRLRAALEATGYPVAEYAWSVAPAGDYIVYGADGGADFLAGNTHAETGTTGTVDLFTRDPSPTPRQTVETALRSVRAMTWALNTIQFEEDSGYIHLEWRIGFYGNAEI